MTVTLAFVVLVVLVTVAVWVTSSGHRSSRRAADDAPLYSRTADGWTRTAHSTSTQDPIRTQHQTRAPHQTGRP